MNRYVFKHEGEVSLRGTGEVIGSIRRTFPPLKRNYRGTRCHNPRYLAFAPDGTPDPRNADKAYPGYTTRETAAEALHKRAVLAEANP